MKQNDYVKELEKRIEELEKANIALHEKSFVVREGDTVSVPKEIKPIFDVAQKTVGEYFQRLRTNPAKATIDIDGQRYLLIRASALSYDFLKTIKNLYANRGEEEAFAIGKNFLFDIAHVIGMEDAKNFHKKMNLTDPIAKLSAGPVHFAYTGWAYVDILPESSPTPDNNYFLIYNHPFSFEANSWMEAGQKTNVPVCIMNSGYSSGWCEESFGLPLTAVEISCKAKGDDNCTFIMAPPHRIKDHVKKHLKKKDIKVIVVGNADH
ncbi:MAG: XylR N-terminal domain-containing protein [Pseudomonadales bacterium]|nr:XylR N-terminal domain-containing protein [Pseudomonadales bacterium]